MQISRYFLFQSLLFKFNILKIVTIKYLFGCTIFHKKSVILSPPVVGQSTTLLELT